MPTAVLYYNIWRWKRVIIIIFFFKYFFFYLRWRVGGSRHVPGFNTGQMKYIECTRSRSVAIVPMTLHGFNRIVEWHCGAMWYCTGRRATCFGAQCEIIYFLLFMYTFQNHVKNLRINIILHNKIDANLRST